jgi:hypothetical protein
MEEISIVWINVFLLKFRQNSFYIENLSSKIEDNDKTDMYGLWL